MGKQKPKKRSGKFSKVYREFTRVKFSKYRLQFPKIRQSEIIAKIIKEWQAMDQEAKADLQKKYIERSGKGFLQDPSSSDKKASPEDNQKGKEKQKQKEKEKEKTLTISASARSTRTGGANKTKPIQKKKKKKPSPKVRVFSKKQQTTDPKLKTRMNKTPDFKPQQGKPGKKSPGKKSTPQKNQTSSSQLAVKGAKKASTGVATASKQKRKNEQYLNFYKYYHERLSAEHPRWSTPQITTIIKLLWRKRNLKGEKRHKLGTSKGLSGRQLYTRTKQGEGFLRHQIKQLWRALPHESKRYWQIKGRGKPHRSKKSGRYVRRVLNAGASREQGKEVQQRGALNWMNRPIK